MACMVVLPLAASADSQQQMIEEANAALAAFQEADSSITQVMQQASGYAVFNSVGKAGIGVGGAHGKGVLFEGGEAVGRTRLTQLSIGWQLGGQVYSEAIFFENEQALLDFKKGNFALGAQVSAVAAAAGASLAAPYSKGVKVITHTKTGLMYEATVSGQKFKFIPFGEADTEQEEQGAAVVEASE